jgi:hypothetical protein
MNTGTKFGTEAELQIKNDQGDERSYTIKSAHGVFVGKSSNCGIQLDDSSLADIHCRLELDQGSLRLQKWLSAGGIKVNHQEIDFEVSLAVNDLIQLGDCEIRIIKRANADDLASPSKLEKSHAHRTDGKHLKNPLRIEKESETPTQAQPSSQIAATDSLEKLQHYLNEICSEGDLPSSNVGAGQSGKDELKNENTVNAPEQPTLEVPAEANLVEQLRQEITKLQSQLSETAERNDRLQHRLMELSERKGERRGNDGTLTQRNATRSLPASDKSGSSAQTARSLPSTERPNRSASHGNLAHTTARTKSLTTKRLSNAAIDGINQANSSAPNSGRTEDRIQSLRTQLREQYESNKTQNSILSRLTQLWK